MHDSKYKVSFQLLNTFLYLLLHYTEKYGALYILAIISTAQYSSSTYAYSIIIHNYWIVSFTS